MPATPSSSASRARRFSIVRCLMTCFSTTVIITGAIILIVWLSIRPKNIEYTVDNAAVRNYNFSDDHLTANFTFTIKAKNPNRKVSIYYDSIEATLSLDRQPLESCRVDPFYQPRENTSAFNVFFSLERVALSRDASKDLKEQSSKHGAVAFELVIYAKIRFKVWFVKSGHWMKVDCNPNLPLSTNKTFQKEYCGAYI